MADIKQKIIASDETSAAYASARKRVNDYSGAVRSSAQQQAAMGAKAANAAEGVGQLRGALNGSTEGMSRMANAAGKHLRSVLPAIPVNHAGILEDWHIRSRVKGTTCGKD